MSKSKRDPRRREEYDDEETFSIQKSDHFERRMELRKERALRTKNVDELVILDDLGYDPDADEPFFKTEHENDEKEWRQYLK